MRVAVFSTKSYDRAFLTMANEEFGHDLVFFDPRLTWQTCPLAMGFPAVCAFVNDQLDAHVLVTLAKQSVRLIAMRCAGFNNVDLRIADQIGLTIARVPAYSPHAVAEHTVGLMLALNRRFHKAYNRVREGNFALDGLLEFDFCGRTVGVVGTGRIGTIVAKIMAAFGCPVVAYDVTRNPEVEAFGAKYVALDELLSQSDVITLHCPLVPETYHLLGQAALAKVKRGVMIVNTSRGALIDTREVV
jgi:D-lactate dehydrogenase